jgi:hypothetical protein
VTTDLIALSDERSLCPDTELVVVPPPQSSVWRVYNTRYRSPLNPPARGGEADKSWSRFDVAGHATLYAASAPHCAYAESLAYAEQRPGTLPLHEIFHDLTELDDPVADEWAAMSHLPPGQVPAEWRDGRRLAEIIFEPHGWFVDLSSSETVGVLRRTAAVPPAYWSSRIDLSDLMSGDRQLTSAVAAWLCGQVLADGSAPRGLKYTSRHGGDLCCWALWVPLTPGELIEEAVARHAWRGKEILIHVDDPALRWATRQLGLKVW